MPDKVVVKKTRSKKAFTVEIIVSTKTDVKKAFEEAYQKTIMLMNKK
jgi:hypothetical protein